MATIDHEKNVAYYDIIPYYSNPGGEMNYRWPGVLLDDVEYEYAGRHAKLHDALRILSPMGLFVDGPFLIKAMCHMLKSIATAELADTKTGPDQTVQLVVSGTSFMWDDIPMARKEWITRLYLGDLNHDDPLRMSERKLMLLLHVTLAHAAPMLTWKIDFPNNWRF